MSEVTNVYIEDTRDTVGMYHAIQDMKHRNPRTKCSKPISWAQYSVIIPLEWAKAFGISCQECENVMAKEDDE